ncbi:hypothetical protein HK097_010411 [Rhizophlyctis rosea]|uniref:Phosphoinositide phospholipase C n=1 Tax=Rhizophlyctis rosea TaxID=64517 RepID=A0AAD5X7F6_9FUNG|nr:hypothetical protein HK097_010411 [Rhizophlyctis rosea]
MTSWLRKQWQQVDEKNEGKLDLDDVTDLFRKLNIKLSKSEVKSAFKNANIGKMGSISFPAFERLHSVLRFRPEISEIFASLSKTKPSVITFEEFKGFVYGTQKVNWTEERCHDIYRKYTSSEGQMDMNHFSAFMISANNAVFKKSHADICMDMTRPLQEYFINTSHNTYLLGDQLTGESSVEGYIRALQRGCRCVELDCYDGPNGPRVYHGSTLVTRLSFKDVIESIARYAFVASDYPLIISLETHCTPEQQNMMAKILRDAFGESLCTKAVGQDGCLPSPQALKGKVIIKAKVGPPGEASGAYDSGDSDDDGSPLLASSESSAPRRPPTKRILSSSNIEREEPTPIAEPESPPPPQPQVATAVATTVPDSAKGKKPSAKSSERSGSGLISARLAELVVYCKGRKFAGLEGGPEFYKFDQICSLSESKSAALLERQRKEYIEHNKRILTRVYPAGIRVTSTNYDPIPHWSAGAQLVALNYQTVDKGIQLNHAMFKLNGRSGYVLKPSWLRASGDSMLRNSVMLSVKIISAQQLPKPKDAGSSIIDPFVEVEVCGTEADSGKFRTKYVNNNGFNPQWKEEFRFLVKEPELAFLRLQVFDRDSIANDFVGYHVISLQSLEEGYRHIPLYDWKGELVRFSTLFVCTQIRPVAASPTSGKPDSLAPAASPSTPTGSTIEERRRSYQSFANGVAGFGGGGIVTTSAPQKKKAEGAPAAAPKPVPVDTKGVAPGPVPQPGQVAGVPVPQQGDGGPATEYAAPVPFPASPTHPVAQEAVSPVADPDKGVILPVLPTPAEPAPKPVRPAPAQLIPAQPTETAKPQ